MTDFGLLCPAASGHLNPMTSLGHALRQRGHRVTRLAIPDGRAKALAGGLEFEAIGAVAYPEGSTQARFARLGELSGSAALRATLTHRQRSTALPMVAIPITNDQPGVAARVAWSGTGAVVPLKRLSERRLRQAIEQVLWDDRFCRHAARLQASMQHAGGVARAADLVEQAIGSGRPVLRESVEPRG